MRGLVLGVAMVGRFVVLEAGPWQGSSSFTPPKPTPLTEYQKAMLEASAPIAAAASLAAETVLLDMFKSTTWSTELKQLGDDSLSALSADDTLEELKRALTTIEYATSFGLSAAMRIKQPGMSSPNVSTIDDWGGVYPNQWQLKYYNSTLVREMPNNQWDLYQGGETALYHLKPFANPAANKPSWLETTERPTYVTINNRRQDLGNEPFGVYGLVYRGSVVKERAVIISGDSGEFENACNSSIHTPRKWFWKPGEKLFYHCEAMGGSNYTAAGWHPTAARSGMELHTVVNNAKMFSQSLFSPPGLARLVGQIISKNANVVPLEQFLYTEAVILGSVRMQDAKFVFSSFELFATKEGDDFISFCRKYELPCTWALGFMTGAGHWWNALPFPLGTPKMPAGRARVLDISTVQFTNGTKPSGEALSAWSAVDLKVRDFRRSGQNITNDQFQAWFAELSSAAQTTLWPLRGAECFNTDLCIGTDHASSCVCRNNPDKSIMV